jgi:hypothetical protein
MRTFIPMAVLLAISPLLAGPKSDLPRFTEEREAAAMHFVKKHLPELIPLLTELKKSSLADYQREVREIFQETEMLADLVDDPKRHELELKVWKAENRSHVLVARLRTAGEDEKKKMEEQLKELSRELVELDIQVMEVQAEQLDKELGEVKDELARARDEKEQNVKARYERLLEKSRKPKK